MLFSATCATCVLVEYKTYIQRPNGISGNSLIRFSLLILYLNYQST